MYMQDSVPPPPSAPLAYPQVIAVDEGCFVLQYLSNKLRNRQIARNFRPQGRGYSSDPARRSPTPAPSTASSDSDSLPLFRPKLSANAKKLPPPKGRRPPHQSERKTPGNDDDPPQINMAAQPDLLQAASRNHEMGPRMGRRLILHPHPALVDHDPKDDDIGICTGEWSFFFNIL